MSSQRSFSNSFPRRLNSSSRSSFFRDFPIDDEDMFFESNPNWDFPPSGQLGGSIFDTFPRRSTMRSFPSHHFENTSSGSHDPFASGWHHPSWVEDEMRRSQGSSPSPTDRTDSRRSPTPPNPTSSGPRSGSGSPGVGSQTFFGRNDGFPIKVVHEGTSRTPSRSSTPSSGAGEANPEASCESPTVPPPGVEKFPGVTSKVHSNAYSARRLPKVHHIPIRVEPRDDGPGPSPSRATPPPPNIDPRSGHNGDNASPCASPRHNRKANQSQPAKKSAMPRVIPVQMNSSKCQTPPPPADRLPTPEHQERAPSPAPPRKTPPTPFEVIEGVLHAVHEMEERVGEFSGTRAEKEYLFLDEMLTRNLIKLDNIETDGNADLRQSRKGAIQEVNRLIHKLEANVVKPPSESETMDTNALVSEQPTVAEEPMESDPNAAPSIEKGEATETVVKDNSLQAHVEIENADSATKNNVSPNTADVAASTVETSDSAEPSVLEVTTTPEAVDSYTESKDIQKTEQESKPVFKTTVELQVAGDCTVSLPNGDAISEELMQTLT